MARKLKNQSPDSTPTADRWSLKRGKPETVWSSLKQSFGIRFLDQFGTTPSEEWAQAINSLTQYQIDGALQHMSVQSPPYAGWIPTLGEFMATARRMRLPQMREQTEAAINGTWVDTLCGKFSMQYVLRHPKTISNASAQQLFEISRSVCNQYNQILAGDPTLVARDVMLTLAKRFQKVELEEASEAEMDRLRPRGSRAAASSTS